MTWNYRVLATESEKELMFEIHEVYYDNEGKPSSYTENAVVTGEDKEEMKMQMHLMNEAMDKPVIWGDDRFPQEFEMNQSKILNK